MTKADADPEEGAALIREFADVFRPAPPADPARA